MLNLRSASASLLLASCGWLPPDTPPKPATPPLPVDRDTAALVHAWTIADHVLGSRNSIDDDDARALHGRRVAVDAGYTSPWHGSCEAAGRQRRERMLEDVAADQALSDEARAAAGRFGLVDPLVEYRLSCTTTDRVPHLVIYVAGPRAMTCFAGACYLLRR